MTFAPRSWIDPSRWSLMRRQLAILGGCLTLLAVLLGVGGAWFIHGVAERSSDRLLAASGQSIIDTIGVEGGHLTLEISPNALNMLAAGGRNSVFYSVTQGSAFLTGYPGFPQFRADLTDGKPHFRYDHFLGRELRVVAQARQLPRLLKPAVVQVAETLDERRALARSMMVGLGLLETLLVVFAVVLVWPAILWGLKPLISVRREIDARGNAKLDFAPLDTRSVPQELGGLIAGFNDLLARLQQSTFRVQRFTADASHQLRTPLAALRTHVEILQRTASDATAAGISREIAQSVDRLQRLLTQLLSLARAEADPVAAPTAHADAATAAREVALRLAPLAVAADLELILDIRRTCGILLEPILLEELIANLVHNSISYNRDGRQITIRVDGGADAGQIVVEDDGVGIPVAEWQRLGERFFRLPRDHDRAGSGLGFSIAFAICERAGATLTMSHGFEPRFFQVLLSFPRIEQLLATRETC